MKTINELTDTDIANIESKPLKPLEVSFNSDFYVNVRKNENVINDKALLAIEVWTCDNIYVATFNRLLQVELSLESVIAEINEVMKSIVICE